MKLSATTGVAVAMSIAMVSARATTIPARSVDPQFSPFAKCIQEHHPGFPKDGSKPTSQEMHDCVDRMQPKARRAEAGEDDVLFYEPEAADAVKPRGIVDTVQVLGKQLYLNQKPWCEGKEVHDNFVWVEDIVSNATSVCLDLKDKIDIHNLKKDGGVSSVLNYLTNGHDKQGHQLKDKRHVTASYLLNFYPPAKMAIEEVKQLAAGIYDLCNDGIMRIGTKEKGCTAGITYFRPSKAKTYHGVGAIGGTIRMFFGEDTSPVADLSLDFSNDG
jgi:hypothetical protein